MPLNKLILDIAQALSTRPESVSVHSIVDSNAKQTGLCLRVAPSDMIRVVGKDGRTGKSLGTLVAAAGMKVNRRYDLCICEQHAALLPTGEVDPSKVN